MVDFCKRVLSFISIFCFRFRKTNALLTFSLEIMVYSVCLLTKGVNNEVTETFYGEGKHFEQKISLVFN